MTQVLLLAAAASVIAIYELTKTSDPDPPPDSGNGSSGGNNNPDPNSNPPGSSNPAPGGTLPATPTTPVTPTQTFQPLTSYSDQWTGQCHEFDPYWYGGNIGWGAYQDKGLASGMESESTRSKPLCATLDFLQTMNEITNSGLGYNNPMAALSGQASVPNSVKFDPTKVLGTDKKRFRYIVDGKVVPFTERDVRAFGFDDINGNGNGKLMIDPSNRQAILDWMNASLV